MQILFSLINNNKFMTNSQAFISKNKMQLECGRDYYNPDTSLMHLDEFERSKLKVLIVFPSPSNVKAVSSTKEALNDYVIAVCNAKRTAEANYIPGHNNTKLPGKERISGRFHRLCIPSLTEGH